ncbi:hypothetical protein HHL28_17180 [Aerophototrophica crusticola]|uniref:Uncharacterized protein n=1 Tax=Aerophototrophica crusticola TaxID=1709002 RepID=A0A858RAS5_9PROT|nr:hypothetical protein HHL28_17180 [Rhodospirillaceae bacterium B3]
MTTPTLDLVWWITAIEVPALAGLFWMIQQVKRDTEQSLEPLRAGLDATSVQLRDALAAFKLEVAKTYASQDALREVEQRLTAHLLRIETKLDGKMVADGGVR